MIATVPQRVVMTSSLCMFCSVLQADQRSEDAEGYDAGEDGVLP